MIRAFIVFTLLISITAFLRAKEVTGNPVDLNDPVKVTNVFNGGIGEEEFLKSFFSPDTVPLLNIKILENALGDLNQDNVINILDLLRLRDIIVGRPPSPTSYELSEGDLTHNGTINSQDLTLLHDILTQKVGVPYLIDSSGGQVMGDGIILNIPPGAVDSAIVISIKRFTESEFAKDMGVDTEGAV